MWEKVIASILYNNALIFVLIIDHPSPQYKTTILLVLYMKVLLGLKIVKAFKDMQTMNISLTYLQQETQIQQKIWL